MQVRWPQVVTLCAGLCLGMLATNRSANAQRIFRVADPLEITFTTQLRNLVRERDSTQLRTFGALATYTEDGKERSVPVTLRARGHFRRQARNCDFPPIRLDIRRRDADTSIFRGNTQLKISTTCRPGRAEYEQYTLLEYIAYRTFQLVSPYHYRTRLARVTYRDSANATPPITTWAFFIEDDAELARHYDLKIETRRGARYDDIDQTQLATSSLFQFMIGNTDWSVGGLHNITMLRDSAVTLRPVPYDFDWSGLVNARYASPDPRWKLRRVTDRLYIGPCVIADLWVPIISRFTAARPAIDSMVRAVPGLEPARRDAVLSYYAGFWRAIGTPKAVKENLIDGCGDPSIPR